MTRSWRRRVTAVLAMAIGLLVGCASAPPLPRPPPGAALPPQAGSVFEPVEQHIASVHGPDASGFHLLDRSDDALRWRLLVIDGARHSIDVQVYVWFGDASGQLLLSRVIAAADRGVRVRLLLDDLSTMLRRMTSPELRDRWLARVDRHPNIEVRVFNPWRERRWVGRIVEGTRDFARLNRRMHNKQLIADNRAVILGGRNLGDEYLGLNAEFIFHDLDVLGIGPVARQASVAFDQYWNSDWVRRIPRPPGPLEPVPEPTPEASRDWPAEVDAAIVRLQQGMSEPSDELARLAPRLQVGRSRVRADPPSRAESSRNRMTQVVMELMASAQREVLISNAYVIPDEAFVDLLRGLVARGVRVRLLTNSLASHDVPAVNAHYEGWRRRLLGAGVDLYEWRPDPTLQGSVIDLPPIRSGLVGLHTKALVVDRERSFIGSMNLDPRSEVFNAEMGVVIDSAALGKELAGQIERDLEPTQSWRVDLDDDGHLRWTSSTGELGVQPARSLWQRVQNLLFKLAPASYY